MQSTPQAEAKATDRNLERAIAVGNLLAEKTQAEINAIEALPPPTAAEGLKKESDRRKDRIAELNEVLTGKRKAKGGRPAAFDYPWSDKGLTQTVTQATNRVSEIERSSIEAGKEATRTQQFDAFIDRVAVADPDIRRKITLAKTGRTRFGMAPSPGLKEARDELDALTKVFDAAMAGRPISDISTEDMPGWIPAFMTTSEGKDAFEDPATTAAATVAPTTTPTAAPTTTPTQAAAGAAPAAAGAPAATTTTTGGRKIDPGLTPTPGLRDLLWEAPYRTNLEEAYRQAAYIYYQQEFDDPRFGEMGTDPRGIEQPMIDAFTAIIEEGFSGSNSITSLSDEQKMAFLEAFWLDKDQGDPPEGVQHDYENIQMAIDAIGNSKAFQNLADGIRDTLDSVSDKEGLTKRFSRNKPPSQKALRHELNKKFGIGPDTGEARKKWIVDMAAEMWADIIEFTDAFTEEDPGEDTLENQWATVMQFVEKEASRPPEEREADFDRHKRKAKGMYNKQTIRSKLVEGLIEAGKYDSLPSGKELNYWLDTEAARIHEETEKVYYVTDDDNENDISGADETMARLIVEVGKKPLNDLMDEMEATPDTVIEDWLDEHPSNADLKINEKQRLLSGAQSFYDAWTNDMETELNFQDWMNDKGAGVREDIATEQKEIAEGRNEKAGVKQWFLGKAITAGKYTRTASKELRQAMDAKFEEYWAQVQDLLIPVEGEPEMSDSQAQNTALKSFMPDIPDSSEWQRELDEKKAQDERDRVGALKPPLSIEQGFGQATERLEERVGGPTLDEDLMENRKNIGRLKQDIFDFQGNKFPYYADGVGITQAEFDEQYQPALDNMDATQGKEYLSNLGITTYDEQLGQMDQNLKSLESDEGKLQSQFDQTEYDKEVNTLMMDSPQLSQAFASGSVEGLKTLAGNLKIPAHLVTHLLQKQQTGGHVLTESEKRFRVAAGLPLPADYWAAQQESAVKRDADLMRQQMRTTQFEATGEERTFTIPDWEKLGYDPLTMTRTGPLTGTASGMPGREYPGN